MSVSHRIQKTRNHLSNQGQGRLTVKTTHRQPIRAMFPVPAKARSMVALERDIRPTSVFLVARRPPLSEHPFVWRWLARFVYKRIQWAPDFGIEYQGVYTDASEARHVASGPGMFVIEMPFNASLPFETCQYGTHDFPSSEASHQYRNRKFPFVAIPRNELDDQLLLEAKIEQVARAASAA